MPKLHRILLAEDNALDAELALEALNDPPIANEVIWVKNGEEVLDYLYGRGVYKQNPPEHPGLILLDLKMPKIDGLEVLRLIKSDPVLKMIPVIMLTSSREEQDLVESYQLGVNAYVVKPVDFTQFIAGIKTVGMFWGVVNEVPSPNKKDTLTIL